MEEAHRRTLQLQKQTVKENKKATQERARYEKEIQKIQKNQKMKAKAELGQPLEKQCMSKDVNNRCERTVNFEHTMDNSVEAQVNYYKNKVKQLNPIRRARKIHVESDGSNNPNVEGQDNRLNAWLDVQLNGEGLDQEATHDARYAKINSDNTQCYDVDHIPIRGLPKIDEVQSDCSATEIAEVANALMDDDNVSICRDTGIMRNRITHNR